jgi:putative ABC transport system permease protein
MLVRIARWIAEDRRHEIIPKEAFRATTFPAKATFMLDLWKIARLSLTYHRWMLWPVALGVAVATSVIVGALLVGDSVRGSLHFLAMDRLGKIEWLLIAPRFFQQDSLEQWLDEKGQPIRATPAILFPKATVVAVASENRTSKARSASNAMVLGITSDFWNLGEPIYVGEIPPNRVVLNESLAGELQATIGDKITLRLPSQIAVPADNPLGKRESETTNLPNLIVEKIVPNRSLGRFDLRSNQRPAKNAYVSLTTIQAALDRDGQINSALMIDAKPLELKSFPADSSDLGIRLDRAQRLFPDSARGEKDGGGESERIYDYLQVTSDQMLIPDSIVDVVTSRWPAPETACVLTYLANAIQVADSSSDSIATYSTVSAIEPSLFESPTVGFGTVENFDAQSWDDEAVVINQWLAEKLQVAVGDRLKLAYFLPEVQDGKEIEKVAVFRVAAIVPLTEPAIGYRRNRPSQYRSPPTPFNDPNLTPEVPGITDQASMNDWDLPFQLTRTISEADDDYWTKHHLTPKLFMTLKQGQKLFGSRFGKVSSIRIAHDSSRSIDELREQLRQSIQPQLGQLGWQLLPIRATQLKAAQGTTPFDGLFLALSFFVILSGLILIMLLFRLAIERRLSQWGLLQAVGWPLSRVRRLLSIEGLSLSFVGGLMGTVLGVGYAAVVLYLLRTSWVGAVGTPFLDFFVTPRSLIIGLLAGLLMAWLTILLTIRRLSKQTSVDMLRNVPLFIRTTPVVGSQNASRSWLSGLSWGLVAFIVVATVAGLFLNGQAASGAFIGAGMLSLAAMLIQTWRTLTRQRIAVDAVPSVRSLPSLATTSIFRQPTRSVLTIGLMSVATLLILSMSLFELSPDVRGTGGFSWLAESNVGLAKDLNDPIYRNEVLGEEKAKSLDGALFIPMRSRDGDDAGCNNLYQATQPKILGIHPRIADYSQARSSNENFAWAAVGKMKDGQKPTSPWQLLEQVADGSATSPFPVIIDQNTALWALHLTGGIGQRFSYLFGDKAYHFEMVAQPQNTILQGSLFISEENFRRAFPEISGYRAWLVSLPTSNSDAAIQNLETGWSDEGMDAVRTESVLSNLLAVQNTYLKAFQSLGALGLLLGAIGLGVAQLRSVMERQSELGLLQAIGFAPSRIGRLVFLESLILLGIGLGIGCLSAGIALVPPLIRGLIQPTFLGPSAMVAVVGICGALACLFAVRQAMQLNVLRSIRQG